MSKGLKPYSAYKDSGVPSLGKVPEHWEVRRLGQIGRFFKGNGGNKDDEVPAGVPCVRYGDLYTTHTYFVLKSRSFIPPTKVEDYTPIRFGDVLFAASGETIDEIGKSAVNLMRSEAYCGGDVILFRPAREFEARYMGYATDCRAAAAQKARMGRGITVKHIYGDQLKCVAIALPPSSEQLGIVRFLDHADRRIRPYIRVKRKLIMLLEEQKQALINRAVTRGHDPNVRRKPSGVGWLGDVPEHWEVARLSQFFTLQRGFDITKDRQRDGVVPVVSSGGISSYHDRASARGPGVIVGRKGTAGAVHFVNSDYWAHDTTLWVNDFKGNCPRFVYYVLSTLDLKRFDTGSANPTLNRNLVHPERIALPPPEEQARIAAQLDASLEDSDRVVGASRHEIALLLDYRTRLIADVVTGKLDVSEVAAALPDEPFEAEEPELAEAKVDAETADEVEAVDLPQEVGA